VSLYGAKCPNLDAWLVRVDGWLAQPVDASRRIPARARAQLLRDLAGELEHEAQRLDADFEADCTAPGGEG
jgi:hypothetical protein